MSSECEGGKWRNEKDEEDGRKAYREIGRYGNRGEIGAKGGERKREGSKREPKFSFFFFSS